MSKWSIRHLDGGGYFVKLTTDRMEVGSYPLIKNPWLRFMYPWASTGP